MIDYTLLLPLFLIAAGALACLLSEAFISNVDTKHQAQPWIGCSFLAAALLALYPMLGFDVVGDIHGIFAFDATRAWIDLALVISTLCGLVGLQHSLRRESYPGGEPYALMLLSAVGVHLMIHAIDGLALFIGIELASLSIYALIGLRRNKLESGEGLLKYFIMGAIFSALYLYGVALLFGATGTTQFGNPIVAGRDSLGAVAYGFMFLGLLFKVGVVPFHFWSPDAYTAAPLGVTGFMASAMKLGGFTAIGVLWLSLLNSGAAEGISMVDISAALMGNEQAAEGIPKIVRKWSLAFLVLGVLSIAIGNLSALGQTHARRILAFSSVAHAGYMLLAFPIHAVAGTHIHHLWYYLIGYGIATSASFAAIALMSGKEDEDHVYTLSGQARRHPFAGVSLTLCLTSLAGVPLTMGFLGKFMIFSNLVEKHHVMIAVVGMLLAVVGAVYYFRLIIQIWQPKDAGDGQRQTTSGLAYAAIACALICVVGLLLFPELQL